MTICIVGHRDIAIEEHAQVRKSIDAILKEFKAAEHSIRALSLVASGADTIFYDAATALGITVEVLLPFEIEKYRDDFATEVDLKKFEAIAIAQKLEEKKPLAFLTTDSKPERDEVYLKAGKHLIDLSDCVVAVWDGKTAHGIAGTAKLVAYAQETNKELRIVKANRTLTDDDKRLNEMETETAQAKKIFKRVWITGIALGFLSAVFFAPTLFFKMDSRLKLILSTAELICLPTSYLFLCVWAKRLKARFLEKRIVAERQRMYVAFKKAGFLLSRDDAQLGSGKPNKIEEISLSKGHLNDFIADQIKYHRDNKIKRYEYYESVLHTLMNVVVFSFFTVVLLGYWTELEDENIIPPLLHLDHAWLKVFWVLLPAFYASLEVIHYFLELKLNITISNNIIGKLQVVENEIKQSDENTFFIWVEKLRALLHGENQDWKTIVDSKHIGPHL